MLYRVIFDFEIKDEVPQEKAISELEQWVTARRIAIRHASPAGQFQVTDARIQVNPVTMPADPNMIPLPERPGTMWKLKPGTHDSCEQCGRGYATHGASESDATRLGVPFQQRHLICRWSDEEWEEFNRLRRRAKVERFVYDVQNDLAKYSLEDQTEIVRLLVKLT